MRTDGPERDDTELTPEERAAFAALPRERAASRLMEERTVGELRRRGLLRRARRPRWMAAAAALALFAGGFGAGWASRSDPSGPASLAERPAEIEPAESETGAEEARRILWL